MDRPSPFSDHDADVGKRAITGFLAGALGFVICGFVLIPLWLYWPFQVEASAAIGATFVSIAAGFGYAVAFGVITATGLEASGRTWVAAIALGLVIGVLVGLAVRSSMLYSCSLGTGPQPEWCSEKETPFLRPIVPVYGLAGAALAGVLHLAAMLRLGERVPRLD
ncbi:MAG: hypothetical protein ACRDKT_11040 [Actinomycetota bacterium]